MSISSFFQDISNYFSSGGSTLGIDIGTSSIKAVELSTKGGGFVLKNYGILDTKDYLLHPNLALQSGSLSLDVDETSRLISILLKEMNTDAKNVVMSVPVFTSFVNLIDAPALSSDEMANFINIQAYQYVPIPMDQVSVDWVVVDQYKGDDDKEHQRIMIIGIPNKSLQVYRDVCKNLGLRLASLELDVISLARSVQSPPGPTLVIDIGAEATTVFVMEDGLVKHTSQTDYSGVHITRALSNNLELGMLRAEDLKRRHGLLGSGGGGEEFSTLITPFLNVIIEEVGRVAKSYEEKYGKGVRQFTLTGGGSNLSGIKEHFIGKLGLKYSSAEIFRDVDMPDILRPASHKLGRELSVAVGLSKRYFEE